MSHDITQHSFLADIATRRAIFRAAVEIGRAIEKKGVAS